MLNLQNLKNKKILIFIFLINVSILFGQESQNQISVYYGVPENSINKKKLKIQSENSIKISLLSNKKNIGLTYYLSKNSMLLDEIFYQKKTKKNLLFKIGKFSNNDEGKLSLSSGDMIESNNALGIPRYLIEYENNYKKLKFKFSVSDGLLDKNDINIEKPFYHDKRIKLEYSGFSFSFTHNAIWGGKVTGYGKQPSDFDDYFKIFFNQGGGADAVDIDKPNRLGDVFGSWNFGYKKTIKKSTFHTYHQFYFEDKSGLKLKNRMNKFDGLTGILLNYNNTKLIFERIKTSNQGGKIHPPGRDGYYWNGIYRNGWKYKGRVIGNIFILPNKNRIKINHFGLYHKLSTSSIKLFFSKGKIYNISYNGSVPAEYEQNFSLNDFDKFKQISLSYNFYLSELNFEVTAESNSNDGYNIILKTAYSF